MEFPDLGRHCNASGCGQLVFLPIHCTLCDGHFCSSHSKPELHACENAHINDRRAHVCPLCNHPIKIFPSEQVNDALRDHISSGCRTRMPNELKHCQYNKCTQKYIAAVTCSKCHRHHCIHHQMCELHECKGLESSKDASTGTSNSTTFNGTDPFTLFEKFFGRTSSKEDDDSIKPNPGETYKDFTNRYKQAQSRSQSSSSSASQFQNPTTNKLNDEIFELPVTLEDLYKGTQKQMKVTKNVTDTNNIKGKTSKVLTIDIKPGYKAGTKIKFHGEGDRSSSTTQDVVFIIKELPHERYRREGNNLIYKIDISLLEALTGYTTSIHTLDGRILPLHYPAVIFPGYAHSIPGEGMPNSKLPHTRGTLIVKFNIVFPRQVSLEQKEGLTRLFSVCK